MGEAAVTFWGGLTATQREALLRVGAQVWFEPDEPVLRQGEPDRHLVVILAGAVKVVTSRGDGSTKVVALRGPGSLVGEIAALTASPRTAAVRALSRVGALVINHVEFEGAARADPGLHDHLALALAERLREANQHLLEASVPATLPRLAALLASLGDQLDTAELPISQADLASLAATSEASVARAVRTLRDHGLIRTGRRRIILMDSPGLRRYADTYDAKPSR